MAWRRRLEAALLLVGILGALQRACGIAGALEPLMMLEVLLMFQICCFPGPPQPFTQLNLRCCRCFETVGTRKKVRGQLSVRSATCACVHAGQQFRWSITT